ncbi:DUF58 domain-containing protein [bacterium]|nr:DUF58 domain-containing protein [bacterium]
MIPKEILKKIRHIDIVTNRLVTDVFAGSYHSVFKGRGIEFSDLREYDYGDDIRSVDWKVFARTGKPHIKLFKEERELSVVLLVDVSASSRFGTRNKFKSEICAEVSALFSFSAIRNNDKVGLILCSDSIEKYIRPQKGKKHVLSLIRDVLCFETKNKKTNLKLGLEYLNNVVKKRAVVFLISDFMDDDYEKVLRVANKKHDVIPVVVSDPAEEKIEDIGLVEFEDAETGQMVFLDTKKIKEKYAAKRKNIIKKREKIFVSNNMKPIELVTNEDYIKPIIRYFKERSKRL